MKIGYDLTIEQTQKLTMTPELIQAIQILQFNAQELDEFVRDEIMQNPILEYDGDHSKEEEPQPEKEKKEETDEEADFDLREKIQESRYDDISYKQWQDTKDKEAVSFDQFVSKEETLDDFLYSQLIFSDLDEREKKVGGYIIEALDENGYLSMKLESIAKACNSCVPIVEKVLTIIQTFEPLGVGARSLEECLLIQLKSLGKLNEKIDHIIRFHLRNLGENKLSKVAKENNLTINEIQEIVDLIRTLEPKPGRQFSTGESVKYIVPDITVEKIEEDYVIKTNDSNIPRLIVSPYYMGLVKSSSNDEELSKYLSNKYNSALWLIRSIDQRKQTIFNVSTAVVERQKEFFERGVKHLKPLTLREVADDLGIHESTVSRAINGKYMQTPHGVFELRYFFSSGVSDSSGEGMASTSIKTFIKEIIDEENPKKPYSDQYMVDILSKKGISISRRTVAKYREDMNIPSSPKRRRY